MGRIVLISLIIIMAMTTVLMSSDLKDAYRTEDQGYPQIIQESDYATIRAIEALYNEISSLGKGQLSCKVNDHSIGMRSTRGIRKEVLINIPGKGPITINDTAYSDPNTVALFITLKKILADLSVAQTCSGVTGGQFSTRAYKKRTILDFDLKWNIIELDSFSNGPDDEERLYTLDIVRRKESFFYSH